MSQIEVPAFTEPLHVGRPNIGSTEKFHELVGGVLERRWLSNDGPLLRELETRVAQTVGVKHCVAVTNGTIALEIAIRALGLTGEVIVPSWTFIATVHALRWVGLTPVFADVDPETHCLDPESVRSRITARTSGILAVHLWGRPAPVDALEQIAQEHGLKLLFDASHSFGVSSGNTMVGNFGDAEVFSFHATKFFNTLEGGAVVTNNDELAGKLRLMRNFGFAGEDNVVSEGTNGKMNEVCAAMGLVNIDYLDEVIDVNHRNYSQYRAGIEGIPGLSILSVDETGKSNYQYVVLLVDESSGLSRDRILADLRENNILARRYFWPSCHRMEPYRTLEPNVAHLLPHTEMLAERVIVLPTGTAVNEEAINTVVSVIRQSIAR
ncbi:MAG: DegT/DnrJ/EryC1/StrS family aminotransferase [Microbacteriaceae bacterium]